MQPQLETQPPFVIKVYDKYFHISWDGLSEKAEDIYHFEKIRSIGVEKIEKERPTLSEGFLMSIFAILLDSRRSYFWGNKETEGLVISFKNGENEIRYFHDQPSSKYAEAIELIKNKISVQK